MKYSVLVVDDDQLVNELMVETVRRAGYGCESVFSGEDAMALLKRRDFDIILCDLKMKEVDGITLLKHVRQHYPETTFVIMTAFGTVETAVKAIKQGAYDFLLKPVTPETVEHILVRITELMTLRRDNEQLRRDVAQKFHNIVGKSSSMQKIFETVQSIADARSTVLLTGPSGTGKELIARAIHYASVRQDGPFIKLNCAALPEHLVEAELFGFEKGSFTDARRSNRGRFERADGGTLLLDEISEMPMNLQPKILRVLQEREFERLGSSDTIAVDVRVIATSNRNLKEYVAAGHFREDLYYRLNVIPIEVPPLEERKEDIPLLVEHFIAKHNQQNNRAVQGVDQSAMQLVMNYHWPGNVRQLENAIEHAVVTSKEPVLTADHFSIDLSLGRTGDQWSGLKLPISLHEGERVLILKTLKMFGGNKKRTADALGVTARTIRNKLAEYNMVDLDPDGDELDEAEEAEAGNASTRN